MNDIIVRPYLSSDYEHIAKIHDAARKIELSFALLDDAYLPFSIASEREDFFEYPHIDIAIKNEEIVGFCAYTEDELAWLYVLPDKMRQKIGSLLVSRALSIEPNINEIEVLLGNEPARKLYESFDFHVDKIVEGVMPGNESFAVKVYCMRRTA